MVPIRQLDGRRTLLGLGGAFDAIVEWPGDTVPCLRLAAALLGGVLARWRADADQKALERRMQDAQRLESLGVLAGGIAHDFNNLLTTILGNASLLRTGLSGVDGASEGIEEIEAASRRAAELCRQMLAYAGRGRFALQLIDLNALLNDMRSVLEVTVPRAVDLTLRLSPSLPSVLADESQLRQLIMNLVFNAIEALDKDVGAVSLSTDVGHRTSKELATTVFSPDLPDAMYVSLKIRDTGIGMSAETVGRIFDPFFSTKFTGRGLGLSAAVGIVRAHQGALCVESAPGLGSTFELILPAQAGRPTLPIPPVLPTSHASMLSWRTTGTALVVDDERGVRDLARTVLERVGMTVVAAETAQQAIDAVEQLGDEVRVVLVDLTLPEMDGRQALAAIRRLRPGVPAILMSGYSPTDLLDSTSHIFLQKPFTPGMLRAVTKRALDE
jgi:signal transduction histidine kinase/CheY-like chemotaxis protein